VKAKPLQSSPDDTRAPTLGVKVISASQVSILVKFLQLRDRLTIRFPRPCSAVAVLSLALTAGACGNQDSAKTEDPVEIIYPEIAVTDSLQKLQLKLRIDKDYLANKILPNYSGPPLVAINYKNMKPGDTIPYQNPDIVLASAMLPTPKVPDYRSDYMEQPFVENFEWFKDTGQKKFGLTHKVYQVVDVPDYPASDLYLKEQKYHDFYIFCGFNKNSEQDLCILGTEITIFQKNGQKPAIVILDVRLDRRSIADWAIIERQLTKYFTEKLEVVVAGSVNDG
jgi:hypothetical protein